MTTPWLNQNKAPLSDLLLENGGYILQETSGKLILEQSGNATSLWTNQSKN